MQHTAASLQNYATPSGRFIQTAAPFVLFRCDPKTAEQDIVAAQLEARVKGKVLTAQGELYVRWSLGSPEAEERIRKCIQTLEKQANY
jgi:histidinol-phosphate/aromatic aminotransferase/cobyric acid decarboxylase-like protein